MTDNAQLSPGTPNRIEDRAPKAPGVIPKHMQSLVIMGVAVAMILIMWLTGAPGKQLYPRWSRSLRHRSVLPMPRRYRISSKPSKANSKQPGAPFPLPMPTRWVNSMFQEPTAPSHNQVVRFHPSQVRWCRRERRQRPAIPRAKSPHRARRHQKTRFAPRERSASICRSSLQTWP